MRFKEKLEPSHKNIPIRMETNRITCVATGQKADADTEQD